MIWRVIVGIIALVYGSACAMAAMFTTYGMLDRVNKKLPIEQQFDPLGWYYLKSLRLRREYKRLYPDGRLLSRIRFLTVMIFGCLVILLWVLRTMPRSVF